jgi:hypothetical protein
MAVARINWHQKIRNDAGVVGWIMYLLRMKGIQEGAQAASSPHIGADSPAEMMRTSTNTRLRMGNKREQNKRHKATADCGQLTDSGSSPSTRGSRSHQANSRE